MPLGFLLLGMILAVVGAGCMLIVTDLHEGPLARGLFGAVTLVSLVLAEALWWVRPWVARAVDAWTAVCVGITLLVTGAGVVSSGLELGESFLIACLVLFFVVLPCALVRRYVRNRARKLGLASRVFAPQTARVPVPRPRP